MGSGNCRVLLQVALLDFGATRGFDQCFTDVYIEVRPGSCYIIIMNGDDVCSLWGFTNFFCVDLLTVGR